jgi:hypothetical protein
LGKRSAYCGRNVDRTLSIVCGGAAIQHAPVSTPEQFHPLAKHVDVPQYGAALPEKLLAFRSHHEAAADAVKQSKP